MFCPVRSEERVACALFTAEKGKQPICGSCRNSSKRQKQNNEVVHFGQRAFNNHDAELILFSIAFLKHLLESFMLQLCLIVDEPLP